MDATIKHRIDTWLQAPFDLQTQEEVKRLRQNDPKTLEDSFYTDLSFGTGGLRGIMGVGPNRMNLYTIQKTTLGLANYLYQQYPSSSIRVVIGFDSRIHSKEFAKKACDVLLQQGIDVFFLTHLRPTPYVSFSCRHFQAHAAIMITASHNPKEYNGYKVYWSDGAQVVHPHDTKILEEIEKISTFELPPPSLKPGTLHRIGDELDDVYLQAIAPLQHLPQDNQSFGKELQIAYTSLHGTGITLAPIALQSWGFSSVSYVLEQIVPDGTFPTTPFPNPEYPEALKLGIALLQEKNLDLLLATDPDADRLGVVVLHQNKPIILNGNEIASICTAFLCSLLPKEQAKHHAVVTTIVSTDLIQTICKSYGVACFEVLTGFKYIGEKIHLWEQETPSYSFLFGAEESYGYLIGTHSRDKDAIVSCCLLAEIALYCKRRGKTLVDFLYEIYQTYGLFREGQRSLTYLPGKEGMHSMLQLMKRLRDHPLLSLNQEPVSDVEDYLSSKKYHKMTDQQEPLQLPKSDVLVFKTDKGHKLIIRPSGTEPKLKIYAGVCTQNFASIEEGIQKADAELNRLLDSVKQTLTS